MSPLAAPLAIFTVWPLVTEVGVGESVVYVEVVVPCGSQPMKFSATATPIAIAPANPPSASAAAADTTCAVI